MTFATQVLILLIVFIGFWLFVYAAVGGTLRKNEANKKETLTKLSSWDIHMQRHSDLMAEQNKMQERQSQALERIADLLSKAKALDSSSTSSFPKTGVEKV